MSITAIKKRFGRPCWRRFWPIEPRCWRGLAILGLMWSWSAIQMIDDWGDLEDDLATGHYSFLTLGGDGGQQVKDPQKRAQLASPSRDIHEHRN